MPASAIRLRRVGLVTGDLAATEAFYRDSFGFERVAERADDGEAFARLLGLEQVRANSIILRLGRDELELTSFDPPGRPYPSDSTAPDPWFQHFAIVVVDMAGAYGVLRRDGKMIPISTGGPELLPPNTGSVTAYKFRDPEGHPLELSMFPRGVGADRWRAPGLKGNCLGIDHSAISVADIGRSVAFYTGALGLTVSGRTVNRGPEQDRLDGLKSDGVDIVALQPTDPDSPHVELLGYPGPMRSRPRLEANDVAATKLEFQVSDLRGAIDQLRAAGARIVSPGPITLASGIAQALVADPDGHLLLLSE